MEFLSALLTWQVGVAILLVAVIIGLLYYFSKNSNVKYVLVILKSAERLIRAILPDDWECVYDTILKAADAVIDGNLSQAEAKSLSRGMMDITLEKLNIKLGEVEKETLYTILDYVIEAVIEDKNVAIKALAMV